MELNNREIATLVWTLIIFGWACWKAKPWKALRGVVTSFCKPIILRSIAMMATYVAGSVWLLAKLGLWNLDNLKTTLVWFGTFVLGWMFNVEHWQADPNADAKGTLREVVNVTVFVTFLTEFYTFSLLGELVLVPIVTLIALLAAVAEWRPHTRQVGKIFQGLLAVVGWGLLANAAYQLARDFGGFATVGTAREFATPALLSLLFLPFMYAFNVYAAYEVAFITMPTALRDKAARRYAMCRAIFAFGLDVMLLRRWKTTLYQLDAPNREDVDRSIGTMKAARRRERHPPAVPPSQGWSPQAAIGWLKDEGLPIKAYNPTYGEWSGSSPYRKLDDGILGDSLAYYISGTDTAVTRLSLNSNLDRLREGPTPEASLEALSNAIVRLLFAIYGEAGSAIGTALKQTGHTTREGQSTASIVEGDHTLKLVIVHDAHVEPY